MRGFLLRFGAVVMALAAVCGLVSCGKKSPGEPSPDISPPARAEDVVRAVAAREEGAPGVVFALGEESFAERFEAMFHLSSELLADGAIALASGNVADQIALLRPADDTARASLRDAFSVHLQEEISVYEGYSPQDVASLERAEVFEEEGFLALIVSPGARDLRAAVEGYLRDPASLPEVNDSRDSSLAAQLPDASSEVSSATASEVSSDAASEVSSNASSEVSSATASEVSSDAASGVSSDAASGGLPAQDSGASSLAFDPAEEQPRTGTIAGAPAPEDYCSDIAYPYIPPEPAPSPDPIEPDYIEPEPQPSPSPDYIEPEPSPDYTQPEPSPSPDYIEPAPSPEPTPTPDYTEPEPVPEPQPDYIEPEPEPSPAPQPEPSPDYIEPAPEPQPSPSPDVVEPAPEPQPAPGVAVFPNDLPESEDRGDGYFADALFLGDSRIEDFLSYTHLPVAANYAYVSLSVSAVFTRNLTMRADGAVRTIADDLRQRRPAFTKAYLCFGLNEVGWPNLDRFIETYEQVIALVREVNPGAIVYILNIYPVSASLSDRHLAEGLAENNLAIASLNARIAEMAARTGARHINLAAAFCDETGALPEGCATDGVHGDPTFCRRMLAFLRTHTGA